MCPWCIGAALGVLEGYAIARLTGAEYGWKDAAVDASLGAIGGGLVAKLGKLGSAAKSGVRILEREGNLVEGAFKVAKGEARFVGELVEEGETLIVRGAHIEGEATMAELKATARAYGNENGFKKVIIEGGRRTTGARPGHIPRPFTIDVP